jgi:hypothetical protein
MSRRDLRPPVLTLILCGGLVLATGACVDDPATPGPQSTSTPDEAELSVTSQRAEPRLVAEGRRIFRHDDFGDWRFWTGVLRLNELVEGVSPATALELGLKVDSESVPPEVVEAVLADPSLLEDPAVTRALLSLDAVVGLRGAGRGRPELTNRNHVRALPFHGG